MLDSMVVLSAGLEFFFAVVSVILLIGCLCDHENRRPVNRIMIAILVIHALMNAADACIWLWCDVPELLILMKALTFFSYALGYAIYALFACLLVCYIREYARVPRGVFGAIFAWSAFVALMLAISLFTDIYYYWDENGVCCLGSLYYVGRLFGVVILVGGIALVLSYRRALRGKDCAVLILYHAIPLISYAFLPLWDVVPLYMASTISLLLYYIVMHLEHGRKVAEQQARLAQQALALGNSRTAMMLTQIQPHFLHNSLTAIAQLCEKDPAKAKETTLHFSEYLRHNMRSLTQKEPIPFEQELLHVKTYLSIEQVRFGEKLRVVYDIRTTDFCIPSLCLQPIVENAVRHGVSAREGGGTVTIRTQKTADGVEIAVTDDGIGFHVGQVPGDGQSHIGLGNVRERLNIMMGATLRVESRIGVGTHATIRIPSGMPMNKEMEP